jgi:hypothetical protein
MDGLDSQATTSSKFFQLKTEKWAVMAFPLFGRGKCVDPDSRGSGHYFQVKSGSYFLQSMRSAGERGRYFGANQFGFGGIRLFGGISKFTKFRLFD